MVGNDAIILVAHGLSIGTTIAWAFAILRRLIARNAEYERFQHKSTRGMLLAVTIIVERNARIIFY